MSTGNLCYFIFHSSQPTIIPHGRAKVKYIPPCWHCLLFFVSYKMICGPLLWILVRKCIFRSSYKKQHIPQPSEIQSLETGKGHLALSHKPFMFSPISFCRCPSSLSFQRNSSSSCWNLLIPALVPIRLHLPSGNRCSLRRISQGPAHDCLFLSILLLIQSTIMWLLSRTGRSLHHCPRTLKRLEFCPRFLYFSLVSKCHPNITHPSQKEARF